MPGTLRGKKAVAVSVRACVRSARQAKAGIRCHSQVAPHRLGFYGFDARQRPVGCPQRLVAFEAELDQLPAGHRLAINQPDRSQAAVGSLVALEGK